MLRPERMSRVSVTGAKRVLDDVIETVHGLNLVHVTDYDGAWEGFEPGDPIAGADEAAERLVTVRSLQSILDIEEEETNGERSEVDVGDRLEGVREAVNELDDRRDELRDERRSVEERADAMAPIETLGIDLDLLWGYDTLETRVGEGNEGAIREALDTADEVERYETFSEDDAVAVFAQPASGANDVLEDALVGAEFAAIDVPEAEGTPEEYITDLDERRQELDTDISEVESELADLREEHAEFLLAAEEQLAIEVEKREAPLSFATTRNAFVAEGWIPTDEFGDLAAALDERIGEHMDVEELERASYDEDGRIVQREPTESDEGGTGDPEAVADGGHETTRTDGGTADADWPMSDSEPPVVQSNPDPVKPFEMLTNLVDRPSYSELDPSVVLFLTFPAFFGFMIGDLGYGILYMALGYLIYSRFDSDAIRSLGAIGLWAGGFTILFGILYGEIFGLHVLGAVIWGGHPPLEKGLSPATVEWAQLWLVVSLLVGLFHMTVAYSIGFFEELSHGLWTAILEQGSWLIRMLGIWIWIFSRSAASAKPEFLFTVFNGQPFALGFTGFSETVGLAALVGGFGLGVVLFIINESRHFGIAPGIVSGLLESLQVLVNVLSYTRLAAVLLAKAGMAFVVNLLFFGAYQQGPTGMEEFHFLTTHGPSYVEGLQNAEIMFPGLIHMGIIGVVFGVLVFVFGHIVVLALGVTSAGLQAIRLEYVEFLNKFYEGGGEAYTPFGRDRTHTTEN